MQTEFFKEQDYIDAIALPAQNACKKYGYLPSVLIAQSCLQNGYGIRSYWDNPQIESLLKYNNMVGIKSELLNSSWSQYSVWPGKSLNKKTPEEVNGKIITISDDFRIYDSPEQSFCDYLLFLKYASNYGLGGKPKYGQQVLSIKDPKTLITEVKNRGYATSSKYPTNVMNIINKHNLTKYDNLSNVTPQQEEIKMSNIKKIQDKKIIDVTAANKSQVPRSRGSNKIQYIVCHYLGVKNADNENLYGGGYGGHYYISRTGKIYKAANPSTAVVWQCGGGIQGESKDYAGVAPHKFYQKCTNYNSIGIECGVSYDSNWYFSEQSQESYVYLVSKLMDEYGIPIDRVIRHFDVTGKTCPAPWVNKPHNTSWTWTQFKNNLQQYRKDKTITIPSGQSSGSSSSSSSSSTSTLLKKGSTGTAVKEMQTMLIACGYSCGSSGADGDFGNNTLEAVKKFQKENGLDVDGIYGPKSKAALEKLYKTLTAPATDAQKLFLNSIDTVAKMAKDQGFTYGNSQTTRPCDDKKISCDRLIARALYDLGYTDQPKGGMTCGNVETYLPKFDFIKTTKKQQIKPGAVIAVKEPAHSYIDHVFVVTSYNFKTDICDKYDMGNNDRIKTTQPFKSIKLVEWPERVFFEAWNVPDNFKKKEQPQQQTTTKIDDATQYDKSLSRKYVTTAKLNMRTGAGTDKAVITVLPMGTQVICYGYHTGDWYCVQYNGQTGYCNKQWLR